METTVSFGPRAHNVNNGESNGKEHGREHGT